MITNLFANIGVIVGSIYLYFHTTAGIVDHENMKTRQSVPYIFSEVLVGIIMMNFSQVIDHSRYDFRFLLFGLSIKYLGWKVTLPSMILISVARLFWGIDPHSLANLAMTLVAMVILPLVMKKIRYRVGELEQVWIMVTLTLLLFGTTNYLLTGNLQRTLWIYGLFFLIGNMVGTITFYVVRDLRSLYNSVQTDYLTGLLNVRSFHEALNKLESSSREIILAIGDIDFFKTYNDRFGHEAGDRVLQSISEIFTAYSTPYCRFYRVGGEEFAILMLTHRIEEAKQILQSIRSDIADQKIRLDGQPEKVMVTISIGAAKRKTEEPLNLTLKRADEALYQAKKSGRNQVSADSL